MATEYKITLNDEQLITIKIALFALAKEYDKLEAISENNEQKLYFQQRLKEAQELYKKMNELPF